MIPFIKNSKKYKLIYRTGSISVFTWLWGGIWREGLPKTQRNPSVMDMFPILTVVVVFHWCIHVTNSSNYIF